EESQTHEIADSRRLYVDNHRENDRSDNGYVSQQPCFPNSREQSFLKHEIRNLRTHVTDQDRADGEPGKIVIPGKCPLHKNGIHGADVCEIEHHTITTLVTPE